MPAVDSHCVGFAVRWLTVLWDRTKTHTRIQNERSFNRTMQNVLLFSSVIVWGFCFCFCCCCCCFDLGVRFLFFFFPQFRYSFYSFDYEYIFNKCLIDMFGSLIAWLFLLDSPFFFHSPTRKTLPGFRIFSSPRNTPTHTWNTYTYVELAHIYIYNTYT